MGKYIIRRFIQLIPVLIGITFLSFGMMRLAGSDAVEELYSNAGSSVSQEIIDAKREELGLDKPFLQQYVNWLGGMLRGDMGKSYVSGRDVFRTFTSKLPATLLLTALSVLATVLISIPLGVLAAVFHDGPADYILRFFSFIGNSMLLWHFPGPASKGRTAPDTLQKQSTIATGSQAARTCAARSCRRSRWPSPCPPST